MRAYEMMFILKPDLSEEEIAESKERLQKIIADFGGELANELEGWGRKRIQNHVSLYVVTTTTFQVTTLPIALLTY